MEDLRISSSKIQVYIKLRSREIQFNSFYKIRTRIFDTIIFCINFCVQNIVYVYVGVLKIFTSIIHLSNTSFGKASLNMWIVVTYFEFFTASTCTPKKVDILPSAIDCILMQNRFFSENTLMRMLATCYVVDLIA